MYYVYILYSDSLGKYYTGSCADIEKRMAEHNAGQSRYTKAATPWVIAKVFEVSNRSEALRLEGKTKKRGAKRFLSDVG